MARIPSSAAWLTAKYSRAKGQAARKKARLEEVERQLAFHRRHILRYEGEVAQLIPALTEAESQVSVFMKALRLHEHAVEVGAVSAIRPQQTPRLFRLGGMNSAIFALLKAAPDGGLTIEEIVGELARKLPPHAPRLRHRIQVRLHALESKQRVISNGPKYAPERRWMLAERWSPSATPPPSSSSRVRHSGTGGQRSAYWLIRTQEILSSAQRALSTTQPEQAAPDLEDAYSALATAWQAHPLHFELTFARESSKRKAYHAEIRRRVSGFLRHYVGGLSEVEIYDLDKARSGTKCASLAAVRRALKQLLLEGKVQRVQGEENYWRLVGVADESMRTSER
jgi:hypothetical protein